MLIFRQEWRNKRRFILLWALSLSACIFILTPVYNGMIGSLDELPEGLSNNGFLISLGLSLELLKTPLGMYGFLTNFLMNAGGIFGMYLGLSLYTKDCANLTAEYLYTKPISRTTIFLGKNLCLFLGITVVGICYLVASLDTLVIFFEGFSLRPLLLMALSFPLHALFFGFLGILVGLLFPRNRSELLTASLTVFAEYGVMASSYTVEFRPMTYLSPFSYFSPAYIHTYGHYETGYLLCYLFFLLLFWVWAYQRERSRDIALAV